jgi:hypothetical protein
LHCIAWPQYPDIRVQQIQYIPFEKRDFQTFRAAFIGMDGKPVNLENSDMPTTLVLHFRRVNSATPIKYRRVRAAMAMVTEYVGTESDVFDKKPVQTGIL